MLTTRLLSELLDELLDDNPDALYLPGFETAFIGISRRCGQPALATYDRALCIQVLIGEGMSGEDAEDYFEYNVQGSWVGEHTPVILDK